MNIIEYENYQEKKSHGAPGFPYNTYICTIPLDFSTVPLHWHDEMELIYIKKGTGIITVDMEKQTVSAGHIIIITPGQLHGIEQHGTDSMEYENILFQLHMLTAKQADICTDDYFTPLLQHRLPLPTFFNRNHTVYPYVAGCLDSIDVICASRPPCYQLAIKSYLFQLFFHLCSTTQPQEKEHINPKSLEKIKIILKYIETNYAYRVTVEEAADTCGYSRSHFMKFFKQTMGITFTDYLNEYRLTMASRLLLSSDSSVLNVAAECGFENLSYFNRCFKKKFTMTPSSFRNRG